MVTDASNPILVALDVDSAERAVRIGQELAAVVGGFKVGLELLMGPGPALVAPLRDLGLPVFVDAKLHDIPTTVQRAARQIGRWGARWLTVHAAGGSAMLEAAIEGLELGAGSRPAGVLAVTVLTSLDDAELARTGVPLTTGKLVARRARMADAAGCEGVICSVRELGVVSDVAPTLLKVTPGIRPEGAESHDQARVARPEEAIERGADYLVIGRTITQAADPVAAARTILTALES